MRTIVAIGIAGALGALARYGLDGLVSRRFTASSFPWGTFVVNVSGAFVLGLLMTLMTEQLTTAPWLRSGLTIGLLGAYTTFSTLVARHLSSELEARFATRLDGTPLGVLPSNLELELSAT